MSFVWNVLTANRVQLYGQYSNKNGTSRRHLLAIGGAAATCTTLQMMPQQLTAVKL